MSTRYEGPDRRHHRVYVTRHTEYHVRGGKVVAVRPRGAREWLDAHSALDMRIEGKIPQGMWVPQAGPPRPGERLYLVIDERDVVTSPVVAIVRPPRTTVSEYPSSN